MKKKVQWIRVGSAIYDAETGKRQQFSSINQAKAESRRRQTVLGDGTVRVAEKWRGVGMSL